MQGGVPQEACAGRGFRRSQPPPPPASPCLNSPQGTHFVSLSFHAECVPPDPPREDPGAGAFPEETPRPTLPSSFGFKVLHRGAVLSPSWLPQRVFSFVEGELGIPKLSCNLVSTALFLGEFP